MNRPSFTTWAGAAALMLAVACQSTLQGDLSESQANAIVSALHTQHIGATKERDEGGGGSETSYRVQVQNDDVGEALNVLRAQNLPAIPERGLEDVFGEGGLVPTVTEERARYVAALGGELSRSLEVMDGVLEARVHIGLPEAHDFALDEERPRPRASVLLKHRLGSPPDRASVAALVAGAVERLRPEDVAVVLVPVAAPTPSPAALVQLGPLTVTRGSAPALRAILGGALSLHLLLAGLLVFVLLRSRRTAHPPPEVEV
ncbi:MAG: secretion protein [Deltaproteobacteria bacterium]|nr:secretion protein [Deltaproteobacteria bacterium]